MTWDFNFFGLFVNSGLVAAVVAAVLMWPLRKLLAALGAYEWVWHPALVDTAVFVVIWAGVAKAAQLLAREFPSFNLLIG